MAVSLGVKVEGLKEMQAKLAHVSPERNTKWLIDSFNECALLTQKIAAEEMIIRGGRIRVGSKMTSAPADTHKLTSRHGRLRGSISVNRGGLPFFVEVGSDLKYAAIHEFGGQIKVTPKMRAFLHYKGMHLKKKTLTISMPKRPYMKPALDKASLKFTSIFEKHLNKAISQ